MKATINKGKCMGHGMCYGLAPSVYQDDEEGYGVVVGDGVVDGDLEAARQGAANCPEAAITVTE